MKNKLETAYVFVKISSNHDSARFSCFQSQHSHQHEIETNEWACIGSWSVRLACTQLTLRVHARVCHDRSFCLKYDKDSLNQKEKIAKLCLKYKLEADSSKESCWDPKRKKFVANQQSFKSRAVRDYGTTGIFSHFKEGQKWQHRIQKSPGYCKQMLWKVYQYRTQSRSYM